MKLTDRYIVGAIISFGELYGQLQQEFSPGIVLFKHGRYATYSTSRNLIGFC
jgi:hypothetical protein